MCNSIKYYVLAIALGVASPAAAAVMEDIVASVNGQPILLTEYQKEVDNVTDSWRHSAPTMLNEKDAMAQLKHKILDQMVDNLLLEQEAERKKVKIHDRELDNGIMEVKEKNFRHDEAGKSLSDQEVEAALAKELSKEGLTITQFRDRIRKQLMIRKIIDDEVRPNVKPPEDGDAHKAFEKIQFIVKGDTSVVAGMPDDVGQAYVALGSRVKDLTSERVQVSHILVKVSPDAAMVDKTQALKKAQDLRKRIVEGGEDFADVARKNSEDAQSAPLGGDLGFLVKGWMPAEFDKAAFSTGVGDVSQPVETQFGYHLIRVQAKKAAESVSFDKLKDDVTQFLYNLRFQAELDKTVKGLRTTAHIEVNLPKDPKQQDKKDN